MSKMTNPIKTGTAVLCVVMAGIWLSNASVAGVITFGSGDNQFNMEFVAIGNANNADDTTGNPNPAGKVEYNYQMGKFEVSRDMVSKATTEGSLGITMADMSSSGGNGVNRPATGVSWEEAARFVNWLNTSKGYQAAYNFTTSNVNDIISLWNVGDGFALGGSSENLFRHKNAPFWLPSMDEWYKAAYYDPGSMTYFDYPSSDGSIPTPVTSGMAPNTAVYGQPGTLDDPGPAEIMSAGGLSPYGIMGMAGNVFEMEETDFLLNNDSGLNFREYRGGSWGVSPVNAFAQMSSSSRSSLLPTSDGNGVIGFRVASLSSDAVAVPEPSSLIMFSTMALSLLWYRKRLRK